MGQKYQSRKIVSLQSQKITLFSEKFGREPRAQERALLGLCIYLLKYVRKFTFEIHLTPKSCCNFT